MNAHPMGSGRLFPVTGAPSIPHAIDDVRRWLKDRVVEEDLAPSLEEALSRAIDEADAPELRGALIRARAALTHDRLREGVRRAGNVENPPPAPRTPTPRQPAPLPPEDFDFGGGGEEDQEEEDEDCCDLPDRGMDGSCRNCGDPCL
jgi:hypothetical protein